ncbi:MAG: hypothetical protein HZB12_01980 [Candidatus Yonathbacteria bacterium]|nr:hypothetical protein [Candidatus Yonathbacteria bacterium]
MAVLLYLAIVALIGVVSLFAYQFFRMRSGKVERLPNVTIQDVALPILEIIVSWLTISFNRFKLFLAPFLILFYKAILSSAHAIMLKASGGLEHTAKLIKGKELHIHHKYK